MYELHYVIAVGFIGAVLGALVTSYVWAATANAAHMKGYTEGVTRHEKLVKERIVRLYGSDSQHMIDGLLQ